MKIVTANRSDVFDEYLKIISNFNEKNLIKESSWSSLSRETFQGSEKLVGKGAKELGEAVGGASVRAGSISAERFARAGVTGVEQVKEVFKTAEDILTTEKYVIEDSTGKILKLTDDQKAILDAHLAEIGQTKGFYFAGNDVRPINKKLGPGLSIRNVSDKNYIDYAKRIVTEQNGPIPLDELREFRKITADLIGEPPVASGARAATEEATEGAADVSTRPARSRGGRRPTQTQSQGITQNFYGGVPGGDVGRAAREATEALDPSKFVTKKQLRDAISKLKKSLSEAFDARHQELLTKIDNLEEMVRTGNAEAINEARRVAQEETAKLANDIDGLKRTSENNAAQLAKVEQDLQSLGERAAKGEAKAAEALADSQRLATELRATQSKLDEALERLAKAEKAAADAVAAAERASSAAARAGADGAGAVAKASAWAGVKKFLWNAALLVGAIAGGYWLYGKITEGDDDGGGGGSGGNDGSGSGEGGGTGRETVKEEDIVGPSLADPEKRQDLFERMERMSPEDRNSLLERIRRSYQAADIVKLEPPLTINGETITYVFPQRFSGGRYDKARREATIPYFMKAYTGGLKDSDKIVSMMENKARTSDAQEIANYAFGRIAAEGLFSGKGTFLGMGNRGSRFGKGKGNRGYSEFGIAGSGGTKMTREERKALEGSVTINESDDSFGIDPFEIDPMSAFASGQEDFFNKTSENINISTNNSNSYEFAKKADKISNRYFKDAVEDLQDDEFMKAYYAGFSKLHNQKTKKPKPDYEKLYDLHDETGADLIHKAHPKAISVAEAIGNGGLVENESEKSKAMEDIAFRAPSGNYRARYAFIQNALKKKS